MIPVYDTGDGPVLLLVPGLAATARFFEPSVADLSRDHRVIVAELPGHGLNTAVPSPVLARSAAQVAVVVESLRLRDVTLIGHCLGATICCRLLRETGGTNVSALVSVEQTPRMVTDATWPHGAFGGLDADGAERLMKNQAADPRRFADDLVTASFAAGTKPDPKLAADLAAEARRCHSRAVYALLGDALAHDWRPWLAGLDLPTLLIHGARSRVCPPAAGAWLARAMPRARLAMFEDSGHLPFLEEPARFAAAVRAFVRELRSNA